MKIVNSASILVVFQLLISFTTYAQIDNNPSSTIIGNLVDANKAEVMYASVALIGKDSSVVNSAITDIDGKFEIAKVKAGSYSLRIDHIEYKRYSTELFFISDSEIKTFPDLSLQANVNELGEVVVTYRKPLIEIKADKLIFNVSSSPSASGITGLDLLRKTPGVTLDMDDNISLLGKSGVQIYINGVRSRLSGSDLASFLQSITSDNVESIEVISNPSSKYDAEGNAGIINIRMKKNNSLGFNGSVASGFTQGKYLRYNNSLLLNYGGEKVRANFEVSQNAGKRQDDFLDTKIQNNTLFGLDSKEVKERRAINVGFGIEAQLTKKQSLNFSGRSVFNQNDNTLKSQTDIYTVNPQELTGVLLSQSIFDSPSKNHNLNLNHLWNFDASSNLSTAVSLGVFDNENYTQQPNTLLEADSSTVSLIDDTEFDANTYIDLWSAKTDYEKTWENITLSTGLKYAHITTENSFNFYNLVAGEPVIDPNQSNVFNYTESVAAWYAILDVKLNNSLKLNAGLRIENTDSRGVLTSEVPTNNKDVPRNYTDYFPNVGLSFDNQKEHTWSINVGRRINRPNYQDLNPFEKPISQLTIWKGNPFLRPNYIMNYQASYGYKGKLIITNSYSITKGFFANIFEITGPNSNQVIPRNMERATNYGVSISYPIEVNKHWSFVSFVGGSYKTFEGDLEGTLIDLSVQNYNLNIQNNIKLPWDITLDLTFFMESNWIWRGSINVKGNQNLSFGLRKNFLDKRLQLRITGADILRTTNEYFYHGNYGGIELDGVRTFDSQRFGMGLTFKFGNQKAKTKRNNKSAFDEELKRIVD